MAHEVETMFSTRVTPWHGLGNVVSEAPDSRTALQVAGLDWNVLQKDVYTQEGFYIPGYKLNYRDSDFQQLGRKIKITAEAEKLLTEIKELAQNTAADDLVCVTLTGAANTTTNLEHRAKVIFKNAGLDNYKGGLHIFRRTFATNCYRNVL